MKTTFVRTSRRTKVEANQASTGMVLGSHFPRLRSTTLRPNWSLNLLTVFSPAVHTGSSLEKIVITGS